MKSRNTGKVKWFNPAKGYGFIVPQGGGKDVFVHVHDVKNSGLSSLKEGEEVDFDLATDKRSGKVVARDITLVAGGGDVVAQDGDR